MVGQSFSTSPVANLIPAVYGLGIQKGAYPYVRYNFPLTPQSIRKEFNSVTSTYLVAGTSSQKGVQRNADIYGIAPPTFVIEGTTGWKRHQSDGYLLTGLESIQTLEAILLDYSSLNAAATKAGSDLYTLEFFDYFTNSFWEVVPVGPQGFYQDNTRPLLTFYRFRFEAIRSLAGSLSVRVGEVDALAQVFLPSIAQTALNMTTTIASLANLYVPGVVAKVTTLVSNL